MKLQTWLDLLLCLYLCEKLAINLCPKIVKMWNDFNLMAYLEQLC